MVFPFYREARQRRTVFLLFLLAVVSPNHDEICVPKPDETGCLCCEIGARDLPSANCESPRAYVHCPGEALRMPLDSSSLLPAIAGVTFAAFLLLAIGVLLMCFFLRRRTRNAKRSELEETTEAEPFSNFSAQNSAFSNFGYQQHEVDLQEDWNLDFPDIQVIDVTTYKVDGILEKIDKICEEILQNLTKVNRELETDCALIEHLLNTNSITDGFLKFKERAGESERAIRAAKEEHKRFLKEYAKLIDGTSFDQLCHELQQKQIIYTKLKTRNRDLAKRRNDYVSELGNHLGLQIKLTSKKKSKRNERYYQESSL